MSGIGNNSLMHGAASMSRRGFLRTGLALGLGLALPVWVPLRADAATAPRSDYWEATRFLLGTYVTVCGVHADQDCAEQAIDAVFFEIERLSGLLNRHDAGSELAELNRSGQLSHASPDLINVVDRALVLNRLSQGVFDPSVAPLVDLMRSSGAYDPDPALLRQTLELIGASQIRLDGGRVRLVGQGMALTLDGIGKGYIVDQASRVMSAMGVGDHLINAGGDIFAAGRPSRERGWRVALQDPSGKQRSRTVLELTNQAVATSGAYEQTWGAGRHHIVRPDSGICPGRNASVSVTAPTVMEADALATTLFLGSAHDGLRLVDSLPGRECLIIGVDQGRIGSRHWRRLEVSSQA